MTDYDLLVIGAGSGGIRAARVAAGFGARVAIIEEKYLGGTCVNVGCIPKKLLVYASRFHQEFNDATGYGWQGDHKFDWSTLIANKNQAIQRLHAVYDRLLSEAGVAIVEGYARFTGTDCVQVRDRQLTAEYILVATGGRPHVPDFPGREHVVTSDETFFLERLPRRALILGGGYIAVEFACIFNGLGVDTTLVHRGSTCLRGFDRETVAVLTDAMRERGVRLCFGAQVASVARDASTLNVMLTTGETLETDLVLSATGRLPNTANLGLAQTGVTLSERGAVRVDADYRSSVSSIFAVGDVIDRVRLTPVAVAEGSAVAQTLFGPRSLRVNYELIPTAVFATPELAAVGLTEKAARERYGEVDIHTTRFLPTRRLLTTHRERTFMKLIVDRTSDRVLGAHVVGDDAAEIIQGLGVAMKAGATKALFDAAIGIHPTAAEEFLTMRDPSR
ncbi:MAG: glutathione-disulfide reductase [Chromatiales bacterium]